VANGPAERPDDRDSGRDEPDDDTGRRGDAGADSGGEDRAASGGSGDLRVADDGPDTADQAGEAPSPPPAEASGEESNGVVGDLVGSLGHAVEPIASHLVSAVNSVTRGVLGD
jgi:hypothetical protein